MDSKLADRTMLLATPVTHRVLRTLCVIRMTSVGRSVCGSFVRPLAWGRVTSFGTVIDALTLRWGRPTAGPSPVVSISPPILVLMLVIQKNGFLAFDSKLKDPFPQFLDINDVLIMHSVRYIFNETGLKAQLAAISQ